MVGPILAEGGLYHFWDGSLQFRSWSLVLLMMVGSERNGKIVNCGFWGEVLTWSACGFSASPKYFHLKLDMLKLLAFYGELSIVFSHKCPFCESPLGLLTLWGNKYIFLMQRLAGKG